MSMPHKIGIGYSDKPGFKKIAVNLPAKLYDRIRERAVHEKRPMGEMIARLAELGFKGHAETGVRITPSVLAAEELRRSMKDVLDLLTAEPPKRLTAIVRLEAVLNAGSADGSSDRSST